MTELEYLGFPKNLYTLYNLIENTISDNHNKDIAIYENGFYRLNYNCELTDEEVNKLKSILNNLSTTIKDVQYLNKLMEKSKNESN